MLLFDQVIGFWLHSARNRGPKMFPALAPTPLQDLASRDALLHSPIPESTEQN